MLNFVRKPERATLVARQIFLQKGAQRCAWTDRRLDATFAVDHVISFALWGCNDLWNLMPVTAAANAQKSDRLPAAELLRSRKSSMLSYWLMLRDGAPMAFDREAKRLLAVQLLLGQSKLESTVRYLGSEVDDALEISEQTEI
jgi:hypothetical protein